METVAEWRTLIANILHEYAAYPPSHGEIQTEVIIDERLDHYEMIHAGWSGRYRIHGSVIHIGIRDGKIIIQHDGTEEELPIGSPKLVFPKTRSCWPTSTRRYAPSPISPSRRARLRTGRDKGRWPTILPLASPC